MARHIKVGFNSEKKATGSGLTGRVLSRLLAYDGLGARVLRSIVMFSVYSSTVPATLGASAEHRNVLHEDVLHKRMQMLR